MPEVISNLVGLIHIVPGPDCHPSNAASGAEGDQTLTAVLTRLRRPHNTSISLVDETSVVDRLEQPRCRQRYCPPVRATFSTIEAELDELLAELEQETRTLLQKIHRWG